MGQKGADEVLPGEGSSSLNPSFSCLTAPSCVPVATNSQVPYRSVMQVWLDGSVPCFRKVIERET
jgi:hypothetical protein